MALTGHLLLGIAPLLMLFLLLLGAWKRHSRLETVLYAVTMLHEMTLVSFPAVYSILTDYDLEKTMALNVGPNDLLKVLLGENLFIALFAIGYRLISMKTGHRAVLGREMATAVRLDSWILGGLVAMGWLKYVTESVVSPSSSSFILLYNPEQGGIFNQFLGWLGALTWLPSLVACAYVVTRPRCLKETPLRFIVAAGPLVALAVIGVTTGLRGRIAWIISLLAICGYLQKNYRAISIGALLLIGVLPFLALMGSDSYRNMFQSEVSIGASREELLGKAVTEGKVFANESTKAELFKKMLGSLAERAQGPRNSVVLYRQHDTVGATGLTTLVGSLLFPVPRYLWPGKPMTGSPTQDETDSAIYLVMTMGHDFVGYMGPILASAHAYWEGGWFWLAICGVGTGFFWARLVDWAKASNTRTAYLAVICFTGALLIDGLFTMIVPVYSLILFCWKVLLPAWLILAIPRMLRRTKTRNGGLLSLEQTSDLDYPHEAGKNSARLPGAS